jgi:hypothetical protein
VIEEKRLGELRTAPGGRVTYSGPSAALLDDPQRLTALVVAQ